MEDAVIVDYEVLLIKTDIVLPVFIWQVHTSACM